MRLIKNIVAISGLHLFFLISAILATTTSHQVSCFGFIIRRSENPCRLPHSFRHKGCCFPSLHPFMTRSKMVGSGSSSSSSSHHPTPNSPPKLRDAIVLVDPLTDWRNVVKAALHKKISVVAILTNPPPNPTLAKFYPTRASLQDAGVDVVYEPVAAGGFDIYACLHHLKIMEETRRWRFRGVVPLAETAVEYSDVIASMLGLSHHNPLSLVVAKRDKGFMKRAVQNAGLQTAKFSRLMAVDGSDVSQSMRDLQLEFPVVVKTPSGFSTSDVFVCDTLHEAESRSSSIIGSVGPDGRPVTCALLEEFIHGEEFAFNLIASPYLTFIDEEKNASTDHPTVKVANSGVIVTDVWKYTKTITGGTSRYERADMMDPHDDRLAHLVRYAQNITKAVGIEYGMAHVELKAKWCERTMSYIDPTMIEVGARLSGGKKAILTQESVAGWYPFHAMIDAHCGFPVTLPLSFSPMQCVRHVFLPCRENGKVVKVMGMGDDDNFDHLKTHHSHFMLCKVGDTVQRTKDIVTSFGFVWLTGSSSDVEADTEVLLRDFEVILEV